MQIGSEVRRDKQLDELLLPNRNIEETHHDFTTTEQITTEPEQNSQVNQTNDFTQGTSKKTLQLPTYAAHLSFHYRGRNSLLQS